MSEEQLHLIVRILDGVCRRAMEQFVDERGNIAWHCQYCLAISDADGSATHDEKCPVVLNSLLQVSIWKGEQS